MICNSAVLSNKYIKTISQACLDETLKYLMLHFKSPFPSFLNPDTFLLGNLHQYLPFGKDAC